MVNSKSDSSKPRQIPSSRQTGIKLVALISFLLMIALNALANILPINGISTGEVSDSYANLFAPAGFTFSIWGVIYLLLALFTIYQFADRAGKSADSLKKQTEDTSDGAAYRESAGLDQSIKKGTISISYIRVLFIISSIINAVWILAWHYDFIGLSLILMFGLLICLILIHGHLRKPELAFRDKLLIKLPFSVYLGWITVATVANITTWLVAIEWQGWGISESIWTIIVIVAAVLIALAVIAGSRDFVYGLVIIWSFAGILAKHLDGSGFDGSYPAIIISVSIALAIMAVAVILALFGKKLRLVKGSRLSKSDGK
jgi:hypothetical protein